MFTSLFLTIGLIHLIALASPGPDFALILRTSLLIAEHPWLFMAVKVVGALYLGWLGWGALKAAWRSSATLALKAGGEQQGWRKGIGSGLATNLLNPKALLFFMGLLAAMVTPQVDGLTRGLLVLELFLLSLVWFGVLAWSLSTPRAQRLLGRIQRPLNLVTGLLFGAVSLSILTGMAGEAYVLVPH